MLIAQSLDRRPAAPRRVRHFCLTTGILFCIFLDLHRDAVVSGWLVDRFDVNWVIAAGYLLWSLATANWLCTRFRNPVDDALMLGIGES